MTEVLRRYPWRQRLAPLFGASLALLLVLRPAYWPWPQTGGPNRVTLEEYGNGLAWVGIIIAATAVLDFCLAWFAWCRAPSAENGLRAITAEQLQARMPPSFWTALAATIICKTIVDFTFADRPLPAGSEGYFRLERWFDACALAALPPLYLVARWMGPPSGWRITRALVLQAPSETAD